MFPDGHHFVLDIFWRHGDNYAGHCNAPLLPSTSVEQEFLGWRQQRFICRIFLCIIVLLFVQIDQKLQTFSMGSMRISQIAYITLNIPAAKTVVGSINLSKLRIISRSSSPACFLLGDLLL